MLGPRFSIGKWRFEHRTICPLFFENEGRFIISSVKFLIAVLFSSLIICHQSMAEQARVGISYQVANGKLETTSGESIRKGTNIIIESTDSWSVSYRALNEIGQPIGPVYVTSKYWVEQSIRPLTIDDIAALITQSSDLMKEPENPVEFCVPKEVEVAQERDPQMVEAEVPSSLTMMKSMDDLDKYFACYQKSNSLTDAYHNSYKDTLAIVSNNYQIQSADSRTKEETNSLMSCLIFRESAHWEANSSDRGAVGLGQFTTIAINQVKQILRYRGKNNFAERAQTQRDEHAAGRLSAQELQKNLEMIENERKKYHRMVELQALWKSYPLGNRPSEGQIDSTFMANKNNHQAVIALSSLLLRECEIRFKQDQIEMNPQMSLFACAGAYNIGYSDFLDKAINRNGVQSLGTWIDNLKESGHQQRNETINHLVSINRCIAKDKNYAPCGTQENFCQDLAKANACADNEAPLCVGECSR